MELSLTGMSYLVQRISKHLIDQIYIQFETLFEMDMREKLAILERNMNAQIEEAEAELRALQHPTVLQHFKADAPSSTTPHGLAPHWEQVLSFIRQGQEEEAIYALVRVVQRLLDEKAFKKTLTEKANRAYVDSLFDRVGSGVKDNLQQCTSDSLNGLQGQVVEVRQKIADLRRFMQMELQSIRVSIDEMKQPRRVRCVPDEREYDGELPSPTDEGPGRSPSQQFIIHPHRQNR